MDDAQLPELTRRQEEILSLIVRAYTQSPEPVSSKHLVDTYHLQFSTATIRNEMSVLEELGYITAPHTSAGRVPTENGYRYFVRRLISIGDLTNAEQSRITEKMQSLPMGTEQWMRLTATLLSRTANSASLVTPPVSDNSRFKHLELISIQGRLVLMVLVLHGGTVHQQMLTLAEPVAQPALSEAAARLNNTFAELRGNELRMKGIQLPVLEREIGDLVADLMDRADGVPLVYRDGLSETISMFQTSQGAQQAVRVFEERSFLNMILNDVLSPLPNQVQVVIAGDGRWEELRYVSMVLSRYGIPGQISGAVGVLGPTNINYGRAISAVRYISNLMTDMFTHLYEVDTPPQELDAPDKTDEDEDE